MLGKEIARCFLLLGNGPWGFIEHSRTEGGGQPRPPPHFIAFRLVLFLASARYRSHCALFRIDIDLNQFRFRFLALRDA